MKARPAAVATSTKRYLCTYASEALDTASSSMPAAADTTKSRKASAAKPTSAGPASSVGSASRTARTVDDLLRCTDVAYFAGSCRTSRRRCGSAFAAATASVSIVVAITVHVTTSFVPHSATRQ